jgi:glycosyltransferase involved in cell wall biosynthesis/SAM-dependent methyltransferase
MIAQTHSESPVDFKQSGSPASSLHVVQVGSDDSVFRPEIKSDFTQRQVAYGKALLELAPVSRLTLLILTRAPGAKPVHAGNVAFLPVPYKRRFQIAKTVRQALSELHSRDPISVVSTQSVLEDGLGALEFKQEQGVPVVGQIHFELFAAIAQKENLGRLPWSFLLKRMVFRSLPEYSALRPVGLSTKTGLEALRLPGAIHLCPVAVPMMRLPKPVVEPEHKVVFVGRLVAQKRLDLWLRVAAEVAKQDPLVCFEIAGEGVLKEELEAQATSLGIRNRVNFAGQVAYETLPRLYASAKVFLLTSSYEGLPRVVVEAQHFSLPVVASRISGVDEIVEDGATGFLHGLEETEAMAASVLLLLKDEQKRKAMGTQGERRTNTFFDPDKLSKEWMKIMVTHADPGQASKGCLLRPKRPTWKRWKLLSSMRYSLLRALQYESIQGLRLEGKTLDIGGGERNSYYQLLKFSGPVESVNIDPTMRSTHIADLNKPMDLPSGNYDTVISLNTFEHIYHDELAIREAFRVLKDGGRFHIVVPYLYQVHGSPNDYHRHTASWWRDYLVSIGLDEAKFTIEPLVWDPLSSALSIASFSRQGWLRRLAMLKPLLSGQHGTGERMSHDRFDEYALGYYITGNK